MWLPLVMQGVSKRASCCCMASVENVYAERLTNYPLFKVLNDCKAVFKHPVLKNECNKMGMEVV
jgi:hypothetical protein